MSTLVLIKLVGCLFASSLAAATFARDPGLRINRLMAGILVSTAFWGLCEVLWNLETDPDLAVLYVRLGSLGWIWLGPLVFDVFLEIGHLRSPLRWLRPWLYTLSAVSALIYVATPLCMQSVELTEWGWVFRYGPLAPISYLAAALPPVLALLCWRQIYPFGGSKGERRVFLVTFFTVAIANAAASVTDVYLPMLGIDFFTFGSTAIAAACVVLAWTMLHYGHTIASPAAFAQEILATLCDGLAILRPDGRIRTLNDALAALVGVPVDDLEGEPIHKLLPDFEPHTSATSGAVETELVCADGKRMPVSVTSSILYHDRGDLIGEAIVLRDLREIAVLRDRLIHTGRLAAVGELSTSIAHEISDPVADVRSYLSLLRTQWEGLCAEARKLGHDADLEPVLVEGEELIDECLEGVDRVATIVRDVGGFSHGKPDERQPADLNELVAEALRVARTRAPERVQLEARAGSIPPVVCTPPEISQVLLNLLLNAIQAVDGEGIVRCETEYREGAILLRVEDSGCGIAPEVQERIFDPFFTTKPVGEGTGLGLAISYHIVRSHGGEIHLESEPGRGTTFTIELPGPSQGLRTSGPPEWTLSDDPR